MKVIVTFHVLLCVMTMSGTAQVAKPMTLAGDAPEAPTHSAAARNDSEGVLIPSNTALQPDAVIGARMRIRTASTIELPGLIRLEKQTITGPVVSSDVDTVTTTSGADAHGVTVPRPNRRTVGVLTNVTPLTLTMMRDDGSAVTVPRIAIATLERQVGPAARPMRQGFADSRGGARGTSTHQCSTEVFDHSAGHSGILIVHTYGRLGIVRFPSTTGGKSDASSYTSVMKRALLCGVSPSVVLS